jgi:MSHA biogenesis protein MshN
MTNALATIANKDSKKAEFSKAEVPVIQKGNRVAWAVGGFSLSLCLGGWAVSQQADTIATPIEKPLSITTSDITSTAPKKVVPSVPAPTTRVTRSEGITVYLEPLDKVSKDVAQVQPALKPQTAASANANKSTSKSTQLTSTKAAIDAAMLVAQVEQKNGPNKSSNASGTMAVEQVELTPLQLSNNAIERAKKELDSNNLDGAIKEFETALKYRSSDEVTRKKLAALYYGKTDLRKSLELLQHGIRLNEESQDLRLALSNILMKENQPEAALSPLIYMPDNAEVEYLAMRAALAQQLKRSDVATETYQMLVERAPDNARWWLGLAIQQERKMMYQEAEKSYTEAQNRAGVSKQTQAFIRDRLSLLKSLEESDSAN